MPQSAGRTLVRVPYTFVPPEARDIANRFRAEAQQVRELAQRLRSVGGTLESTWEGRSKDRFMGDFNPQPGNLDHYASWLEDRARYIENIRVTMWREEYR